MALEGLETLVGHGVAGPQQANRTGLVDVRIGVFAENSKMMQLQLSKDVFSNSECYLISFI